MTELKILRGETLKVGDTKPKLRIKLLEDGVPFNLTGYDVDLAISFANDNTIIVDSTATIEDESRGIVTYSWQSGETDDSGTYEIEAVATKQTDEITFPNRGTETIYIEDRLI